MHVLKFFSVLMFLGYSVVAQNKTPENIPYKPSRLVLTEQQKSEINRINDQFRSKSREIALQKKKPQLIISEVQLLRDERDSTLLRLLGEKLFLQYRQILSNSYSLTNAAHEQIKLKSERIVHNMDLSVKKRKEFEAILVNYSLERTKIIGAGMDEATQRMKLDSISNIQEQKIKYILNEDQFKDYLRKSKL